VHKLPWKDFTARLGQGQVTLAACQLACLFMLQAYIRNQRGNPRLEELAI
jgi:hypothetical protein